MFCQISIVKYNSYFLVVLNIRQSDIPSFYVPICQRNSDRKGIFGENEGNPMWNKKPTSCHLVLYLFISISPYKLLNMFRATFCSSSGADDLVVFFLVWCSAVTMGSVIFIYVLYLRVDMFVCFRVRWVVCCGPKHVEQLIRRNRKKEI